MCVVGWFVSGFLGFFWLCSCVFNCIFCSSPRRTDARKHALEVERQRAAKVASLPPPLPHPLEVCIHDVIVITISGYHTM